MARQNYHTTHTKTKRRQNIKSTKKQNADWSSRRMARQGDGAESDGRGGGARTAAAEEQDAGWSSRRMARWSDGAGSDGRVGGARTAAAEEQDAGWSSRRMAR